MNRDTSLKCPCGKKAKYYKNLSFNGHKLDGWSCAFCGEEYYNPQKVEQILLINKLKKIIYHLKLSKVKSNLILRIPKEMSDALQLKKGEEVNVQLDDKERIIVTVK